MNVNIICIGKLKENYLKEAQAEYAKRLGAFCRITVTELDECKLPNIPSENEIKAALEKEAARICEKTSSGFNIALCVEGKKFSSEKLSECMEKLFVDGKSTLNFIIGSSYGLSDSIKNSAKIKLSMSDMTFPHTLARIMLLEQIYRAFSIIVGKKYHK